MQVMWNKYYFNSLYWIIYISVHCITPSPVHWIHTSSVQWLFPSSVHKSFIVMATEPLVVVCTQSLLRVWTELFIVLFIKSLLVVCTESFLKRVNWIHFSSLQNNIAVLCQNHSWYWNFNINCIIHWFNISSVNWFIDCIVNLIIFSIENQ